MNFSKIVVATAVIAASAPSAHAQSSTAQAETLFRQGKDLMSKGRIADACAAFDASQKLDPTIATLLNQASCREKNGQLASAWGLFLDAERQSRSATDAATKQLHQIATDHAAKLELRLSTLTVTVPLENRVGGLEILRGTEPVDAGAWDKALPVDGGIYKITARAPGNAEWSSTVTVGPERDAKAIEIPKLKAAELKGPVPPVPPEPRTGDAVKQPEPLQPAPNVSGRSRSRVLPLVLGGAALGLAAGAVGFELSAASTYEKSTTEPDFEKQTSLWNSANTKRSVAIGFGAAGIASAGVAIWLLVRSGGESAATTSLKEAHLILQPIIGGNHTGLVLEGRY